MTDLPDVKLRALANFPVAVTGRTAIDIEKTNGRYYLDLDVSGLVQNDNISLAEVDQSRMLIWNSVTNAYETVPYALAATSGVSSLDGQTGALDIGAGLAFTGDTLDLALFTQTGTGAQPVTYDAIVRGKIYTPEMFTNGIISAPLQTAAASVPDATAAIQKGVDQLFAIGGGTLTMGPRAYGVVDGVTVPQNVFIKGHGEQATVIVHKPTANGPCLYFGSGGAAEHFKGGVSDLGIASADTTYVKIAINVYDYSNFTMRNVGVYGYPISSIPYYTGGGGTGSVGLKVEGRELGTVENFEIAADQPIRISVNPNAATISLDSWTFRDFIGYTGVATNSVIQIDANVVLTNVRFDGRQNWIGGLHGLSWIDAGSVAISQGLYISGIKTEQVTDASGYAVKISHNTALYGLHIADSLMGDRNGVYLRKVKNTKLHNIYLDPAGVSRVGLNADATCAFIDISSCAWLAGTTVSPGALTLSESIFISGMSTDLPTRGIYKV